MGMGVTNLVGIVLGYAYYVLKRKHDYLELTKEYYDSVYDLKCKLLTVNCSVDSKLPTHLKDVEIIKQIHNKIFDADCKIENFPSSVIGHVYLCKHGGLMRIATDRVLYLSKIIREFESSDKSYESYEKIIGNRELENGSLLRQYLTSDHNFIIDEYRQKIIDTTYKLDVEKWWKQFCKFYHREKWLYTFQFPFFTQTIWKSCNDIKMWYRQKFVI